MSNPASERTKDEKRELSQANLPALVGDVRRVAFRFPPVDELAGVTRFVLFQAADALGPVDGWRIGGVVTAGAIAEQVTFINSGTNPWRFAHELGAAAEADRIITPTGAAWQLTARQFTVLWYDSFVDRWRILESNGA